MSTLVDVNYSPPKADVCELIPPFLGDKHLNRFLFSLFRKGGINLNDL